MPSFEMEKEASRIHLLYGKESRRFAFLALCSVKTVRVQGFHVLAVLMVVAKGTIRLALEGLDDIKNRGTDETNKRKKINGHTIVLHTTW